MGQFKPGLPRPAGAGRKVGSVNKATEEMKDALEMLVTASLPQMQSWLDQVAQDNPAKALELVLKMSEFVLPKIGRVEHTVKQTSLKMRKIEVRFVGAIEGRPLLEDPI